MNNKPSIGRTVGFVLPETHKRKGQVVPAIITRVTPVSEGSTEVREEVSLSPLIDISCDAHVDANLCAGVKFDQSAKAFVSWHWLPGTKEAAEAAKPATPAK